MFPSVSACASTKKNSDPSTNMAAVGHLWFFLLLHRLRNYWVDSNETCLLGSPRCLVVQAPNQILVGRQISHFWLLSQTKWNVPFITLWLHLLWNHWTELIESYQLWFPASLPVTIGHHAVGGEGATPPSNPQIYIFRGVASEEKNGPFHTCDRFVWHSNESVTRVKNSNEFYTGVTNACEFFTRLKLDIYEKLVRIKISKLVVRIFYTYQNVTYSCE